MARATVEGVIEEVAEEMACLERALPPPIGVELTLEANGMGPCPASLARMKMDVDRLWPAHGVRWHLRVGVQWLVKSAGTTRDRLPGRERGGHAVNGPEHPLPKRREVTSHGLALGVRRREVRRVRRRAVGQ